MSGNNRSDIKAGTRVQVVQKQDQRSGKLTEGIVKDILTKSSTHPHGIKVRLTSGIVGRVKRVDDRSINKIRRRYTMDQPIRIMPCLDMQNGRVVKGVHFVDIRDAGDPVECARAYCDAGADELALLDITATVEGRATMLEVVKRVAEVTTVPFTVGGGISDVKSAERVLGAGANKVSTSSAAFRKPELVAEMIKALGADKVTVAIDVDRNAAMPSGYEVYIDGGRTATGADAIEFAKRVDGYGVAVILPTSKAGDGVQTGYDLPVIGAIKEAVSAHVVASGGAGKLEHFYEAVQAGATVLLAASVFHFGIIGIGELKDYLRGRGVTMR